MASKFQKERDYICPRLSIPSNFPSAADGFSPTRSCESDTACSRMRLIRRKGKKSDSNAKIELERVIGLTTTNASGLAGNAATGEIAYLAGCVVVIYNSKTNCQTRFLTSSRNPKAFSCVAYSYQGGKFIAAGESGHQPAVIIWDTISGQCITELKAHKIGVSCVEFSPNGKHLVSVGAPHDGFLCLWEWKTATLLSKTRATTAASPIYSARFASDGSFFITAGIKHLRQWSFPQSTQTARTRPASAGSVTLEGRAVNLGSQKEGSFVSISCARSKEKTDDIQPIYVLTNAGILCLLHFGIAVEKWVDLKVRSGFDLAVSVTHVACACSDGIVRFFVSGSLAYGATLPRPSVRHGGTTYPDAVSCTFFPGGEKFGVIYADHSLYIWDIRDFSKIEVSRTFLAHSACIWDVSPVNQQLLKSTAGKENMIDGESFATCSADGSIRLWNVAPEKDLLHSQTPKPTPCRDMLGVVYIDSKPARESTTEENNPHGFRALSTSLDGKYLAGGDRCGNLRIYDLSTLELVSFQEAHDAEILSLSFGSSAGSTSASPAPAAFLASGGRDRLVHLYDVNRDFEVVETLDDHSASITCVKFAAGISKLLSSSADKSVVFRQVNASSTGTRSTRYHQEVAPRGTIYDMDVHPNEKHVVTVGQDKKINILSLATGKSVRSIKPDADVGEPIKARVDPSGTFFICSHSDKFIRLYDFSSGDLLSHASGHAEVITGVTWLRDCRHLISVSGDSCIFVWKLPPIMTRTMRRKLASQTEAQPPPRYLKSALKRSHVLSSRTNKPVTTNIQADGDSVMLLGSKNEGGPAFKFSVSRLPTWAQSKVEEERSERTPTYSSDKTTEQSAESRWVERVGNEGYRLATEAEEETPPATIHVSGFGARRRFSVEASAPQQDSTPESSSNSQTDSPVSSPRDDPPRRETQWKTVHTVFFDETDFIQGEGATHYNPVFSAGANDQQMSEERLERRSSSTPSTIGEHEDGVVVYLDNAEAVEKKETTVDMTPLTNRQLDFEWAASQVQNCDVNKREMIHGSPCRYSNISTGDESDGCDDNFSPCRDLFSAHFDSLSSAAKVDSTTRSSLSARFFARTVGPTYKTRQGNVEVEGLEEVNANDACSLAAERERLKLQQRQDKMAGEVQRMRERLVTLGLSVCESGKSPDKPREGRYSLSPPKRRRENGIQKESCQTSPTSSAREVVTDIEAPSCSDTEPEKEDSNPAISEPANSSGSPQARKFSGSPQALIRPEPAVDPPPLADEAPDSPESLARSEEEYAAALKDLEQATAKAFKFLSELEAAKRVSKNRSSSLTQLTEAYQNALPGALESMQNLAKQMTAHEIARVAASPREFDLMSRPGTSSSCDPSVDIEGMLERYSVRLSESLAHQVLALVQKGLGSDSSK